MERRKKQRVIDMDQMVYNSQKEHLAIPEYGRNVQNLIRHARSIENVDERKAYVEKVVGLIMQMHPQNRNLEDYRDKMWKHVFRIAEYNLPGILPPNGIMPTLETHRKKPDMVPYPLKETKFRHYGHNVQTMIKRALEMEEGPVKDGFVEVIGSYMKLAYRTWNKEHYVSDDIIIDDLETLSNGALKINAEAQLDNLTIANRRRRRNAQKDGGKDEYRSRDNRGGRDRDHRDRDRDDRGGRGYRRGGGQNRRDNNRDYRDRDNRGGGRGGYKRRK